MYDKYAGSGVASDGFYYRYYDDEAQNDQTAGLPDGPPFDGLPRGDAPDETAFREIDHFAPVPLAPPAARPPKPGLFDFLIGPPADSGHGPVQPLGFLSGLDLEDIILILILILVIYKDGFQNLELIVGIGFLLLTSLTSKQ